MKFEIDSWYAISFFRCWITVECTCVCSRWSLHRSLADTICDRGSVDAEVLFSEQLLHSLLHHSLLNLVFQLPLLQLFQALYGDWSGHHGFLVLTGSLCWIEASTICFLASGNWPSAYFEHLPTVLSLYRRYHGLKLAESHGISNFYSVGSSIFLYFLMNLLEF